MAEKWDLGADMYITYQAVVYGVLEDVAVFFQWTKACIGPQLDIAFLTTVGALLALVSPRNMHLSDRSREVVHEMLYVLPSSKLSAHEKEIRFRALSKQVELFNKRYRVMSNAFVALILSGLLLLLAAAAGSLDFKVSPPFVPISVIELILEFSGFMSCAALIAMIPAICLLIFEFWHGPVTLKNNSARLNIALGAIRSESAPKVHTRLR